MLSRETVREVDWDGVTVPAKTQVLLVNTFDHRDREAVPFADQFQPQEWLSGDAAGDWQFNHFSHGPQGCPGAELSMLVGKGMLGTLLRDRSPRLLSGSPTLAADRLLPRALDFFSLRFSL